MSAFLIDHTKAFDYLKQNFLIAKLHALSRTGLETFKTEDNEARNYRHYSEDKNKDDFPKSKAKVTKFKDTPQIRAVYNAAAWGTFLIFMKKKNHFRLHLFSRQNDQK